MAMYGYTATNDRVATRLPTATAWAIQEYTNIDRARITAEALRLFGDIRLYGYKRPCGYTSTCGYTAWAIQEYTNIHRARITAEALRFFGDTYGYGLGYTGVYKHNRKHIYIYIYIKPHKSTNKHI